MSTRLRFFILFGAALGSCLFLIVTALWATSNSAQAAPAMLATPTPTPTPTPRRSGWLNQSSSYTPGQLQSTASTGIAPVLIPPRCSEDSSPLMIFSPTDGSVLQDRVTGDYGSIEVHPCPSGTVAQTIYLLDPFGHVLEPVVDFSEFSRIPYQFNLTVDSPFGHYELYVITPFGEGRQVFVVGPQPTIYLIDPTTQTEERNLTATAGTSVQVRYTGLLMEDQLEVGLYRKDENLSNFNRIKANLIDGWQLAPNVEGSYDEMIEIPPETPPGDYYLDIAIFGRYQPGFFDFPPTHIVVTPYTGPAIPEYITAIVDPVIAWNGLRLRERPQGTVQYTMPPNTPLLILDGPTTTGDGVAWYQVQDQSTGAQGWVMAQYVILGSVADHYINLHWRPGCAPSQPLVERLYGDEQECSANVATQSLDDFADELRQIGILRNNEWLVPVAINGRANQALRIQRSGNNRVGWLRIGTAVPGRPNRSPVGVVWRTGYSTSAATSPICWLRTSGEWYCQ